MCLPNSEMGDSQNLWWSRALGNFRQMLNQRLPAVNTSSGAVDDQLGSGRPTIQMAEVQAQGMGSRVSSPEMQITVDELSYEARLQT